LAIEGFGFAPEAAISRRIRRINRLGDDAFKTELAGVLQDEVTVTRVMPIKLKAGLV
jgi:hypothetical protein